LVFYILLLLYPPPPPPFLLLLLLLLLLPHLISPYRLPLLLIYHEDVYDLLGSGKEKAKEEDEGGKEGVGVDELLIRLMPNRKGWWGVVGREEKKIALRST